MKCLCPLIETVDWVGWEEHLNQNHKWCTNCSHSWWNCISNLIKKSSNNINPSYNSCLIRIMESCKCNETNDLRYILHIVHVNSLSCVKFKPTTIASFHSISSTSTIRISTFLNWTSVETELMLFSKLLFHPFFIENSTSRSSCTSKSYEVLNYNYNNDHQNMLVVIWDCVNNKRLRCC